MDLCSNMRRVRTIKKYSQEDIADALGITQQQYSRYETGMNEIPVHYLVALCKFYGVSADWLLGLKEEIE